MSNIVIATCPYCPCNVTLHGGKPVQSELAPGDGSSLDLAQQTDQRLVTFSLGQCSESPCEHLVLLDGNCYAIPEGRQSSPPIWRVHFFWHHPQLASPDSIALDYVWLLFDEQNHGVSIAKEFRPSVPFCWEEFEEPSDAASFATGELKLSADGFVLFAADVGQFLAEAAELSRQPNAHVRQM